MSSYQVSSVCACGGMRMHKRTVDDAHDTSNNKGNLLAMCQLATASFDDRMDVDKQKKVTVKRWRGVSQQVHMVDGEGERGRQIEGSSVN